MTPSPLPSSSRPPSPSIRVRVAAAMAVSLLVGAVWGGWYARRLGRWASDCHLLPAFKEPPPGPRAPRTLAFGFAVGHARMDDVTRALASRGLACPDAGVRALLAANRTRLLAEQERRRARGAPVDGITGASALRRKSPMERNPQVRLRCDDVAAESDQAPGRGQLLLVFDSPTLPLRHVSFQQTFADPRRAVRVLQDRIAVLTALYGPPTVRPDIDTHMHMDGAAGLPWLKPVEASWRFSDLTVRVSALNFGGARGVSLGETVEVPWPVRPDAPARS